MKETYSNGGKLLIAADAEHIGGELMKRFKTPRPVPAELAKNLECGLM